MNRRGFLASILAAGIAPAVVKAGSLMRVEPIVRVTNWALVMELINRRMDEASRDMAERLNEMLWSDVATHGSGLVTLMNDQDKVNAVFTPHRDTLKWMHTAVKGTYTSLG